MSGEWREQLETAIADAVFFRIFFRGLTAYDLKHPRETAEDVAAAVFDALGIEQIGWCYPTNGEYAGWFPWETSHRFERPDRFDAVPVFSFGVLSPPNTRSQS